MLEELRFSSISDYEYKIIDPITSIFGNIAIVKFRLMQKGMLVDNKAFTGTHITINGRATFVLIMKDGNFIQNGKPEDVISINSTASQKNLI